MASVPYLRAIKKTICRKNRSASNFDNNFEHLNIKQQSVENNERQFKKIIVDKRINTN